MADRTNLAEALPKEKRDDLGKELLDLVQRDKRSREGWETKAEKWFKLWMCEPDPMRKPAWEGRGANVCFPMTAEACFQYSSRAYSSIISAPDELVKILATEQADMKDAHLVEQFLNWQLLNEMEEWEDELDLMLTKQPVDGTAFRKTYWCSEEERPKSEFVSAHDIIVPYRTRRLDDAPRVTHRLYLSNDELEDREDFYIDVEDVEDANGGSGNEDGENRAAAAAREKLGEESPDQDSEPHTIYEIHTRRRIFDADSEKVPYTVWVHSKTGTVLRIAKRLVDGEEIQMFTDFPFLRNPEGFYQFGFGQFLEPLNRMYDTVFNQYIDAGTLSNQPFGFYGKRAGLRQKRLTLGPGDMNAVDDAKQIFFPSMQRTDQALPMILGMIERHVQLLTSNSDPMSGRQQKGVREPTVGATLALIEQGTVQLGTILKRVYRQLAKEYWKIIKLNALMQKEEKQFRVLGITQNAPFRKIRRESFTKKYDIKPTADPTFASRAQRQQEAFQIMEVSLKHPLIGMPGDTGQLANPAFLLQVTKDWLQTYQRNDLAGLLPDMPEPPMPPEVEDAMFIQGLSHDVNPADDDQAHLMAHQLFKDSPVGKRLLKGELGDAFADHIAKHEVQLRVKNAARRAVQPVAPQAPPQAGPNPGAPTGPGAPGAPAEPSPEDIMRNAAGAENMPGPDGMLPGPMMGANG